jgi:hypothetical protein
MLESYLSTNSFFLPRTFWPYAVAGQVFNTRATRNFLVAIRWQVHAVKQCMVNQDGLELTVV